MDILQHIFELLLNKSELTNIVEWRIYAGNLPESPAFPFLEFNLLDTDYQAVNSSGQITHAYSVIQFDALSERQSDVIDIMKVVRNLIGKKTPYIQEIFAEEGEQDASFSADDGSGRKIFRRAIRLQIFHCLDGMISDYLIEENEQETAAISDEFSAIVTIPE